MEPTPCKYFFSRIRFNAITKIKNSIWHQIRYNWKDQLFRQIWKHIDCKKKKKKGIWYHGQHLKLKEIVWHIYYQSPRNGRQWRCGFWRSDKKKLKRTKQYQLPLILTTPGTYEKYLQKLKGKEKILKSRERAR